KFISLEEQLPIFLYSSITGLTVRHFWECFQQSNDTISWYFHKMTIVFSSAPFYTKYVHMPADNEIHTKIHTNPCFWPFFYRYYWCLGW
ncbi:hypothetical protein PAXRUDRAFT_146912, partial [Paxillus rubicundulus Ve08.2h10]